MSAGDGWRILRRHYMGKLYNVYMIQKHTECETVRANSPEEAAAIACEYSEYFPKCGNLEYIVDERDSEDEGPDEDENNGILTNVDNKELPEPEEYHVSEQVFIIY